jgi:hypothetical protein
MRKLAIICFLFFASNLSIAQKMSKYRLPSAEAAVYDNNGNDLRGFIAAYKKEMEEKSAMVKSTSGAWMYMMMRNVTTPATDKNGNLNYTQPFTVTLAMSAAALPPKATWWAREYNSGKGKVVHYAASNPAVLGLDLVKQTPFINEMNTGKMTLVEYIDTVANLYDYDDFFKNTLFVKRGLMTNVADYGALVKYMNTFLEKFSSTSDAVLEGKSYVLFFKGSEAQYVIYLNFVNNKLTGAVWQVEARFEADRVKFVNEVFRKFTGKSVYAYGADYFDMEKIVRKKAESSNLKIEFVKPTSSKVFNKDI